LLGVGLGAVCIYRLINGCVSLAGYVLFALWPAISGR